MHNFLFFVGGFVAGSITFAYAGAKAKLVLKGERDKLKKDLEIAYAELKKHI